MALSKAELCEALFDKVGLNHREARDFAESFFEEIAASLEQGEDVKLSGFGNFEIRDKIRDKPEHPGRNPKTGEETPISARRVVTFHPSQKLELAVAVAVGSSPGGSDVR